MPTDEIRATVSQGFGEVAADVKCDSSATVTITMKPGKDLSEAKVQKYFESAEKKWKVINFGRESRLKAVASYTIGFDGKT